MPIYRLSTATVEVALRLVLLALCDINPPVPVFTKLRFAEHIVLEYLLVCFLNQDALKGIGFLQPSLIIVNKLGTFRNQFASSSNICH